MVRWTRKAQIAPGKFVEAVQFAKDIAELAQKVAKGPPVQVYLDSVGEVGTIRWFVDYQDVASWEKALSQLMANQEYLQRINQAAGLFIQGSATDTIMRAI